MAISGECPSCGKKIKAPDSAAGRRAKCPHCGKTIKIPEAVHDAEEVAEDDYGSEEDYDDDFGVSDESETYGLDGIDEYDSPAIEPHRPCPMCGEMIVANAAKCRFCGEVFDKTLRRKRRKSYEVGTSDAEMVRRFRREVHGLGGFWVFIGSVVVAVGFFLVTRGREVPQLGEHIGQMGVLYVGLGIAWVTVGVFTLLKHLWAVYVGLVMSYLSLAGNLMNLAWVRPNCGVVCGIAIVIAIIVQAHRVIGWARSMSAEGIPLTAKP